MGTNYCVKNWNFHIDATETGNGAELLISRGMVTMNIYITGDVTASTCIFEGKDLDGNWYAIKCANLTTMSLSTQTTGINEVWQVDLTSWNSFRVRISAITAGVDESITIKGKVCD